MDNKLIELFRLASSPDTTQDLLLELAHHDSEIVRGAVASNSSAPVEAIELLTNDKSDHVLECIRTRDDYRKLSLHSRSSFSKLRH